MRVNVYAEEMTDRLEIIAKEIDGRTFTGLRFYLELPVTDYEVGRFKCVECAGTGWVGGQGGDPCGHCGGHKTVPRQLRGPFHHHFGDDDSAAVTFWGKRDLRAVLRKALELLDEHYVNNPIPGGET